MLEEKDLHSIKQKACAEITKIAKRFDSMSDIPKTDWDNLEAVLRSYKHLLMIESMEKNGYSNGYYRDDYSGRRDSMGRYSRDNYSGTYYGNSYDDHVIDDMMRRATPQEREILMRMRR